MYKAKGIRDKKGKLVGGAYMMKNRAGDQAITAESGAYNDGISVRYQVQEYSSTREKLCHSSSTTAVCESADVNASRHVPFVYSTALHLNLTFVAEYF